MSRCAVKIEAVLRDRAVVDPLKFCLFDCHLFPLAYDSFQQSDAKRSGHVPEIRRAETSGGGLGHRTSLVRRTAHVHEGVDCRL